MIVKTSALGSKRAANVEDLDPDDRIALGGQLLLDEDGAFGFTTTGTSSSVAASAALAGSSIG